MAMAVSLRGMVRLLVADFKLADFHISAWFGLQSISPPYFFHASFKMQNTPF